MSNRKPLNYCNLIYTCKTWLMFATSGLFFKKMGHPRPLFLYFHLSNTQLIVNKYSIEINKFCRWLDSNRRPLVIGSDHSTNWATTTSNWMLELRSGWAIGVAPKRVWNNSRRFPTICNSFRSTIATDLFYKNNILGNYLGKRHDHGHGGFVCAYHNWLPPSRVVVFGQLCHNHCSKMVLIF